MKRREFLAAAVSTAAISRVLGANNRVRVGLVGCGGRGLLLAKLARQIPNVEIAAVADVYEPHAAPSRVAGWAGAQCASFQDFRKLLDRKDVDAVIVATPDHWHATVAVLACQAGKDVYVEKPLAHNVKEGHAIVDAARRFRRIVQAGTQHRSAPHFREVTRIVQSGELGTVHFVRVWNYVNMYPEGIGRAPDSDPPPGLDWDFYLGPAPSVPFNKNRFLVNYRWFWDYAGGMVTDFGTHRFDTVHQIMGVTAPVSVTASGGRFELKDGAETPDVFQATYEYPAFVLSYEASMINSHGVGGPACRSLGVGGRTQGMKYYLARGETDRPHGMAFYGTNGTLFADRVGYEVFPELEGATGPGAAHRTEPSEGYRMERREAASRDATDLHVQNFIECIRTRARPAADADIGHQSTRAAHLGNIALRTGRKIRWDATKEEIIGDPEASRLLGRAARRPWDLI